MAEVGVVRIRRSTRLALVEVAYNDSQQPGHETPTKNSPSPDEMLIIERGPRRKPITWSPVDVVALMEEGGERTPERVPPKRQLNPKLRRRLNLSPTKNSSSLGNIIAKKLKTLPHVSQSPDK